jgi:hypothetical protein
VQTTASIAKPTPATTATTARAIAIATSSGAASPRAIATAIATTAGSADSRNDRDWNRRRIRNPGRPAASATATARASRIGATTTASTDRFKEVRQGTAPGYNGDFGSRERYTLSYRDGFRDGYEDGFRGRALRARGNARQT